MLYIYSIAQRKTEVDKILLLMTGGKTHGNNCWMYINIKDGIDQCFSIALNPGIELN